MSQDSAKSSAGKNDGDKAERLRAKVAASRERAEADESATGKAGPSKRAAGGAIDGGGERNAFFKALDDHPVALLAGSVVLGMVAASLLPAHLGRRLGSRALGLAAIASDLGADYGAKALGMAAKSARSSQGKLDEVGGTIAGKGDEARRRALAMGTLARRRAVEMAEAAAVNARDARKTALKRIGEISTKVRG